MHGFKGVKQVFPCNSYWGWTEINGHWDFCILWLKETSCKVGTKIKIIIFSEKRLRWNENCVSLRAILQKLVRGNMSHFFDIENRPKSGLENISSGVWIFRHPSLWTSKHGPRGKIKFFCHFCLILECYCGGMIADNIDFILEYVRVTFHAPDSQKIENL